MLRITRRAFIQSTALATAGVLTSAPSLAGQRRRSLVDRFPDLRRHFVFEYYPWYRTDPWEHWNEGGRHPPLQIASNYMPRLGAYDSRSRAVIEQHAAWIAESGAGAIEVSWWGPESNVNQVIPVLMDVMSDYDIHVSFNIEPYTDAHAQNYTRDVLYLIKNYGDRRHWDCFLLLNHADGASGPVFKAFRTILPPTGTDCHGVTSPVADYAGDDVWRRQTDAVREMLREDFDRIILLADTTNAGRTAASGFDGIGLFDNYIPPDRWRVTAEECASRDLVFSFQVNPGFDGIVALEIDPNSCYTPPVFAPGGGVYDWTRGSDRATAESAVKSRIVESFNTSLDLQTTPELRNAARGFLLVSINSFNEWHEGHQFEPMKDRPDLTDAERAAGYHNADNGRYRLDTLRALIEDVVEG